MTNLYTTPPIAGYVAWYDASDLSTVIATAGAVSQWNDKSANLRNVAQGTGANQPLTGATINGLNALSFDGTNDYLFGARPVTAQPYTVFVAALNRATAAAGQDLISTLNSGNQPVEVYRTGAVSDAVVSYGGTANITSSRTWRKGVPHVVTAILNGVNGLVGVDGGPVVTGNSGATAPGSPSWFMGCRGTIADFWNGYLGEVVAYASALSTANRLAVEQYLMQKWLP